MTVKARPALKAAALVTSLLVIAGCTSSMTSAERNAKKFTYASNDDFDPNFSTNISQSIKLSVPFFEQFWLQGKQDRKNGISREEVNKRLVYFSSDEFFKSFKNRSIFAGKSYNAETPSAKGRKAMSDAVSGAYMDGYEGRN